jgi:nitrite reductase/ring-hydroxylating ferredoxin subunit
MCSLLVACSSDVSQRILGRHLHGSRATSGPVRRDPFVNGKPSSTSAIGLQSEMRVAFCNPSRDPPPGSLTLTHLTAGPFGPWGSTQYVFDDACRHERCLLSEEGELAGETVTCTSHGSEFDVWTWERARAWTTCPVKAYRTQVEAMRCRSRCDGRIVRDRRGEPCWRHAAVTLRPEGADGNRTEL